MFSSTAAATFRQAVALIFDHVVCAESLPTSKFGSGGQISRTGTVTSDVSRGINRSEYVIFNEHLPPTISVCVHLVKYWYNRNNILHVVRIFLHFSVSSIGYVWTYIKQE